MNANFINTIMHGNIQASANLILNALQSDNEVLKSRIKEVASKILRDNHGRIGLAVNFERTFNKQLDQNIASTLSWMVRTDQIQESVFKSTQE